MKKLLTLITFGFLLSLNVNAANEGSGPINFAENFEKRFKEYLKYVKNEKKYSFVFAVHPNGANDFQAVSGKNKKKNLKVAEKKAIKACNKKAKQTGCMVFSRNAQIVWDWSEIPSTYYTLIKNMNILDYINWRDVTVQVGSGSIELSDKINKNFKEYLAVHKNNKNEKNFFSAFAISPDGKVSGDMDGWGDVVKSMQIQGLAVAECMTENKKQQCYIYAINDKIVWKNN